MGRIHSTIYVLGWGALTYFWLHSNLTFATAIRDVIERKYDAIKFQCFRELEEGS